MIILFILSNNELNQGGMHVVFYVDLVSRYYFHLDFFPSVLIA